MEIAPDWIISNGMHKGENSRFREIGEGRIRAHRLLAVSATERGIPVSTLVFEEYPDVSMFWGSFRKDGELFLMNCRGRAGIYTRPEFRGRGLAKAVAEKFIEDIAPSGRPGAVNLVAHQSDIAPFLFPLRSVRNWFTTPSPLGRNHWENQLKDAFRSIPKPTPSDKERVIGTLLSKGWKIREEPSGRLSLHDSGLADEWGKISRTEFAGQVPRKFLPAPAQPLPLPTRPPKQRAGGRCRLPSS